MRSPRTIATILLISAVTLAGCARAGGPAAVPAPSPACSAPAASARITAADDGATVCLSVGATLDVFLTSAPERMWGPVAESGPALTARPNGIGALALGVTGAFYRADQPGTARLTSSRLACVDPGPSCGPATFDVTVIVA